MSYYRMARGWMEHPVFEDEPFTERTAWVWLIEAAAWRPMRKRVCGAIVTLERGQLVGSMRVLGEKWLWDKARVARFLKRLKSESMIETATETGATIHL